MSVCWTFTARSQPGERAKPQTNRLTNSLYHHKTPHRRQNHKRATSQNRKISARNKLHSVFCSSHFLSPHFYFFFPPPLARRKSDPGSLSTKLPPPSPLWCPPFVFIASRIQHVLPSSTHCIYIPSQLMSSPQVTKYSQRSHSPTG